MPGMSRQRARSVSYTHLDVYKRQGQGNLVDEVPLHCIGECSFQQRVDLVDRGAGQQPFLLLISQGLDVYKRQFLSSAEVGGIPGVAVECVDIGRNTSGEGGLLGTN